MNIEERKKIWRITIGTTLKEHGKDKGFRDRNKKGLYPLTVSCWGKTTSTCTLELTTLTCVPWPHYHDSNKIHFLEELPGLHCQSHLLSSSPHLGRELQIHQELPFSHKHSR